MNRFENAYKSLLLAVLEAGYDFETRNGKTRAMINRSLKANLFDPPIITGKKIFYDKAVAEWVWMQQGRTDIEFLHHYGITWWDSYAVEGHVYRSYGYQLRQNPDQLKYVIDELKKPFSSRRARISLWQPRDLKLQAIPCCYTEFDFIKYPDGKLQMVMTFRSSDLFLGFPYDALVGFLLLKHVANQADLKVHSIIYSFINAHIYTAHIDAIRDYLDLPTYKSMLLVSDPTAVDGVDIEMSGQGPYIKADLLL